MSGMAVDAKVAAADEPAAVRARYARRSADQSRYSLLNPAALLAAQERQRAVADLLVGLGWRNLSQLRLLDVGCGSGENLLELLRMGCLPEHLMGIELLEPRAERARRVLPASVRIITGDAAAAGASVPESSQDVVYQSTVFSSLLDDGFQRRLAETMWRWVRPGGGVLWYDFTVNNPRNPDVRGVPVARIRELFPDGRVHARRLTLAPPLARAVARRYPPLHALLHSCAWLRTHVLAWIGKP